MANSLNIPRLREETHFVFIIYRFLCNSAMLKLGWQKSYICVNFKYMVKISLGNCNTEAWLMSH